MAALSRREVLAGLAFGLTPACARLLRGAGAARLADLEANLGGGRLGLFAVDTRDGRELAHRPQERFAMASTFKWALAAAVLQRVDSGQLSLEDRVAYGPSELLDYAPVTRAHVAEGALSMEALCAAAVELSDNTAANLLLSRIGGPAGLTAWIRTQGDELTRLDRFEPDLNSNLPGDARDTSTPRAMAGLLRSVLTGRVLSESSRARLTRWLVECTTGRDRLRAGLPASWRVGDKTGTCEGGANDVVVAWPEGRSPIFVVAFTESRKTTVAETSAVIAQAARVVASEFS